MNGNGNADKPAYRPVQGNDLTCMCQIVSVTLGGKDGRWRMADRGGRLFESAGDRL